MKTSKTTIEKTFIFYLLASSINRSAYGVISKLLYPAGKKALGWTIFILALLAAHLAESQGLSKQWDKSYGGTEEDAFAISLPTSDGGYLLGGYSASKPSADKSAPKRGKYDYWIVKINSSGVRQWDKSFGGTGANDFSFLQTIIQTSDGGYILAGRSNSGISGNKTAPGKGANDYWIIKVDGNGNKLWDKTYGGVDNDNLETIIPSSDGGYVLGGRSESGIGGDKSEKWRAWGGDFWVVKIDGDGNKQWDKTFGGAGFECPRCGIFGGGSALCAQTIYSIIATPDGGYLLGGESSVPPSGDKTAENYRGDDYWVVKIDASGNKQWDKSYGGDCRDFLQSIVATDDGGYLLSGESSSNISGNKEAAKKGYADYWVVKIDGNGNKQWDKSFGGTYPERFHSITRTSDGNYLLVGASQSEQGEDKSESSKGSWDIWLVKINGDGNKLWDKAFGGGDLDEGISAIEISNNQFLIGAYSQSNIGGDKSQNGRGKFDYWVIKASDTQNIKRDEDLAKDKMNPYPNPVEDKLSIDLTPSNQIISIQILDRIGTSQEKVKAVSNKNTLEISVADLKPGIYQLKLVTTQGLQTYQFIKR